MLKCASCGGTYQAMQLDGTQYFHRCPPVSDTEVITALGLPADRTTWLKTQLDAFNASSRVRTNERNENLPGTKPTDTGKTIANGKGVTTVPDPIPPVPLVLP